MQVHRKLETDLNLCSLIFSADGKHPRATEYASAQVNEHCWIKTAHIYVLHNCPTSDHLYNWISGYVMVIQLCD